MNSSFPSGDSMKLWWPGPETWSVALRIWPAVDFVHGPSGDFAVAMPTPYARSQYGLADHVSTYVSPRRSTNGPSLTILPSQSSDGEMAILESSDGRSFSSSFCTRISKLACFGGLSRW